MNPLLTRLGVPPEVQDYFEVGDELIFNYGDTSEHFGDGFHRLPATENLWLAGSETAPHVIITYSAMEAVAFVTVNRHRYRLDQLVFVAIGSKLHQVQINWIRQRFLKRKFTLVFGDDLIGHITAIKLAAGIRNLPVQIYYAGNHVRIYKEKEFIILDDEHLSLHAFQEAFGLRPRLRTARPKTAPTFLSQLQNGMNDEIP